MANITVPAIKRIGKRNYLVAVFPEKSARTYRFNAYLRDYSPGWSGCNIVDVWAVSGRAAKKLAIQAVKVRLLFGTPPIRRSIAVVKS